MNILLVIILGLAVGSFLNVVIYRLHVGVNFLRGRSYCPFCKHDLSAGDLVPIFSFIFLKGKCRYCRKRISRQYPLVELGTTIAFLLLYLYFGLGAEFLVYLLYACILIVIFVFDLKYLLILDKVSLPAIVVAALLSFFVLEISWAYLLIGALVGGGFFFLQFALSRGKWLGGGDIRLGILMGMMLGIDKLILALLIAYFIGAIIGVILIVFGRKKWKSQVPLGTFLTLATYVTIIYGERIIDWYFNNFLW